METAKNYWRWQINNVITTGSSDHEQIILSEARNASFESLTSIERSTSDKKKHQTTKRTMKKMYKYMTKLRRPRTPIDTRTLHITYAITTQQTPKANTGQTLLIYHNFVHFNLKFA